MYDIPKWVLYLWEYRITYIGQGELLAGPLAPCLHRERLKGIYLTWYVDNTAALSALTKACSCTADNSPMALVAGLMAAREGCRSWFEWVPSHQSLSDGLSRYGWGDKLVQTKLARGEWTSLNPNVDWHALAGSNIHEAFRIVRRWDNGGAL